MYNAASCFCCWLTGLSVYADVISSFTRPTQLACIWTNLLRLKMGIYLLEHYSLRLKNFGFFCGFNAASWLFSGLEGLLWISIGIGKQW